MKKTYIAPALLIVPVTTGCQICIGSPNKQKPTDGLGEGITDGGNNPGNFSRRRHRNDWDDEEEEEW